MGRLRIAALKTWVTGDQLAESLAVSHCFCRSDIDASPLDVVGSFRKPSPGVLLDINLRPPPPC